jgi:very-short-patch-repair endonuclease
VLGGLPRPEVQFRVVDEHGFVLARVDLAYPAAPIALEYDGEGHFTRARGVRDRRRDAALAAIRWHTERFTVGDVDLHPPQTVARVEHMLAERVPG